MSKFTTLNDLERSIKNLGIKVTGMHILRRVEKSKDRVSIPGLKVELKDIVIRINEIEDLDDFFNVQGDVREVFGTGKGATGFSSGSDFILRKLEEFIKEEEVAPKVEKEIDAMQISHHEIKSGGELEQTILHRRSLGKEEFDKQYNVTFEEEPNRATKIEEEIDLMISDLKRIIRSRTTTISSSQLTTYRNRLDGLEELRFRISGIK